MALAIVALLLAAGSVGLITALLKPAGECSGLAWRLLKLASTLTLHPQGRPFSHHHSKVVIVVDTLGMLLMVVISAQAGLHPEPPSER